MQRGLIHKYKQKMEKSLLSFITFLFLPFLFALIFMIIATMQQTIEDILFWSSISLSADIIGLVMYSINFVIWLFWKRDIDIADIKRGSHNGVVLSPEFQSMQTDIGKIVRHLMPNEISESATMQTLTEMTAISSEFHSQRIKDQIEVANALYSHEFYGEVIIRCRTAMEMAMRELYTKLGRHDSARKETFGMLLQRLKPDHDFDEYYYDLVNFNRFATEFLHEGYRPTRRDAKGAILLTKVFLSRIYTNHE